MDVFRVPEVSHPWSVHELSERPNILLLLCFYYFSRPTVIEYWPLY